MLRKLWLCSLSVLLLAFAASAQNLTVDQVIAKNIEARGGLAKLKSVKSLRITAKMNITPPGIEAPMTLLMKRPNNLRSEFTVQGMTAVQGYDGKNGWQIMPFQGKKDPEPMGADDLKDAEEQADFDGPLVDYKEKGNTVELMGKESVEGGDAYKLKVTLKNGDIRYIYIDPDSFLDIKTDAKRTIRGAEQEIETTFGDYKDVDGMMMPFSIEASMKGPMPKQKLTIEKVEVNPQVEDSQFKMPAPAPDVPSGKKPGQ